MVTLLGKVRPARRRGATRAKGKTVRTDSSIREVCLLGGTPATVAQRDDRLAWAGRTYRVESVETTGPDGDGTPVYLHLVPLSSPDTAR